MDFLDLSVDLTNETVLIYRKPNDISIYIHVNFNQPPSIIKELSNSISKRISRISSSEEIFDKVVLSTKQIQYTKTPIVLVGNVQLLSLSSFFCRALTCTSEVN